MRSLLRSLFLVTAMVLGGGTFAQLQYWATVYGQVSGCYPGQVITVTSSYQTVTATVDPNCYYWASVYTAQNPDTIITSTPCQGAIQMVMSNVTFNGVLDSALVNINFNCGGGGYDCLGILNGPNVPGTACSDNDPMTVNDVWSPSCVCSGTPVLPTCQAAFSIAQTAPYTMQATNLSTGTAPIVFNWWLNGTTSTVSNPTYTFSGPGTYGVCLTITTADACTSVTCDTLYVDSAGTITYSPSYYDCLGALNGPSVPGTPCQIPGTILQGYWSPNCTCDSSSVIVYDCYGWANGPNLPGTACADTINGVPYTGVWSASCLCLTNGLTDCLGIVNGPNMPGTPCNDGDTLTVQDMWTPNCTAQARRSTGMIVLASSTASTCPALLATTRIQRRSMTRGTRTAAALAAFSRLAKPTSGCYRV
ncbi:MAG: PKD domain-containing protein [Flavobacteriales bacterium]|nr:PKD domain-containing protein [Flavobacteriales bacterium]